MVHSCSSCELVVHVFILIRTCSVSATSCESRALWPVCVRGIRGGFSYIHISVIAVCRVGRFSVFIKLPLRTNSNSVKSAKMNYANPFTISYKVSFPVQSSSPNNGQSSLTVTHNQQCTACVDRYFMSQLGVTISLTCLFL